MKRDAEKRVAHLRQNIARADYQYYVLDNPDLPDGEYDKLMIELRALEAQYPDLVTPDSPTQRVSGEPVAAVRNLRSDWPVRLRRNRDALRGRHQVPV